jgi:hypothetical protein
MEHISDGDLLLYCLGVIREESDLRPIEEHLLWCQSCLNRAEVIDGGASEPRAEHEAK